MGEYAEYRGEQIKIGTCEEMYYLRADQVEQVSYSGSLDGARFRFPWPDEDGIEPGAFGGDFERIRRLDGVEPPAALADEHYSVQFSAANGYLVSLPCPESGKAAGDYTIHRNGYGGAVHLCQQKRVGGLLVAIVKCGGCGLKWRLDTLEDAQPVLDALEADAVREDRTAELNDTPGNAEWAKEIRETARRLRAGYEA